MDTRSRKSRSRTPHTQLEAFSKEFVDKEVLAEESVRITRSTTTSAKVREVKADAVTVDEVTSTNVQPVKKLSSKSEQVSCRWFKTSDYSSEDGENEVSSTKTISLNEKNQIIKDAKAASSNGKGQISALDLYKQSGRYWDIYPKTDYTYSPHSRDRVEIAPGVVAMPNMSRKPIHSVSSSSDDSHLFTSVEHKQTNTESYGSRGVEDIYHNYKPRQLFNNNYEGTYSISTQKTRSVWSRIRTTTVTWITTIITTFLSIAYFGFKVQISLFTKLHKLTSRIMLMDTWLLWKNKVGNKATKLTALCVIPLLLLGGWWLWLNLASSLIANKSEEITTVPMDTHVIEKITNIPHLSIDGSRERIDENEIFVNQQKLIDSLRYEVTKIRSEMMEAEKTRQEDMNKIIRDLSVDKTDKSVYITQRINRCCKNPMIDMESYISKILAKYLNDPEFLRNQRGFTDYLKNIFVARQESAYRLGNITANIDDKYTNLINENSVKLMDGITSRIRREIEKESKVIEASTSGVVTITDERIKQIVRSVLAIYDADKTGLVDYAMESMGAQILSTRCTENYHYGKAVVSVLGIPLWYPVNSPRTLITPGISPGQCWAFQNFPGFVMIRLSKRIQIEAFSIEHINRLLVPNGEIDAAPKHFEVYGLTDENDKEPVLLGEYLYDYDGEPLQFFNVQKENQVFEIVELRIISNHGNPNYTCLYRFRVHGKSMS
ncbi:klaroid protein-like [Diorhabda sublineata]|uniref:klaroid protein-like n=1 Tax=Diorhabda sublineata TaxID=1163346 RepID=UPI0024E170CA|nr:klaroid protein-like [Diorhabda sublineata]